MSITPLFYIALSSYSLWRFLGTIGISYILHCCGSWYYLLCHWEKTYTTVFTFLMAKQNMGNFETPNLHRLSQLGKLYMYKKTTVNLFQTSNISKFYIKKTYRYAGSIEIKTCPVKVMSRSEFKSLSISFLGHPGCLIHLVLYWLWKALQGFQKNK